MFNAWMQSCREKLAVPLSAPTSGCWQETRFGAYDPGASEIEAEWAIARLVNVNYDATFGWSLSLNQRICDHAAHIRYKIMNCNTGPLSCLLIKPKLPLP